MPVDATSADNAVRRFLEAKPPDYDASRTPEACATQKRTALVIQLLLRSNGAVRLSEADLDLVAETIRYLVATCDLKCNLSALRPDAFRSRAAFLAAQLQLVGTNVALETTAHDLTRLRTQYAADQGLAAPTPSVTWEERKARRSSLRYEL